MYRIDNTSAVPSMPAPGPPGTPGWFTDGNPAAALEATIVDAWWCNILQEEILTVVQNAGITPNKASHTQLWEALESLYLRSGAHFLPLIGGTLRNPAQGPDTTLLWISGIAGQNAVIRYSIDGLADWRIGVSAAGNFAIHDQLALPNPRLNINGDGLVRVWQTFQVDGGSQLGAPAMLSRHPQLALEAATKGYIDAAIEGVTTGTSGYVFEAPAVPVLYGRWGGPPGSWENIAEYFLPLTGGTIQRTGAHDILTIAVDSGAWNRITFVGTRLWKAGVDGPSGVFLFADEEAGISGVRMTIGLDGVVNAYYGLYCGGNATIVGAFSAYSIFAEGITAGTYGIVSNTGLTVAGTATVSNLSATNNVTSGGGVNVTGGNLTVNNALVADTVAGGVSVYSGFRVATGHAAVSTGNFVVNAGYVDINSAALNRVPLLVTNSAADFQMAGITFQKIGVRGYSIGAAYNGHMIIHDDTVNSDRLWIDTAGNLFIAERALKPNPGPWEGSSDVRLKKDVTRYQRGLEAVCALRPVSYRFNGLGNRKDDGKIYQGLVAQEVIDIMPEMVGWQNMKLRPDDEEEVPVATLDATALTYALVNAVQALTTRLEAVERRS